MDIDSVFIYLLTFGISSLCIFLSEHTYNKVAKNLLTIIGIFVVCFLAAVRDPSVGSDVKLYLTTNYNYAIQSHLGFSDFFKTLPIDNELLFAALIYIASQIKSYQLLCFVIELLVVGPVVYVLKKEKNCLSVTLGYTLFLLLFYNFSLSGMRASIAMSLFLLSFYFWQHRRLKLAIFYCIVAFGFQKSTFFIIILSICIYLIENSKRQKKMLMRIVLLIGLSIALVGYNKLSTFIIPLVNMINPRYGNYMQIYLLKMPGFTASNIPSTDIIIKTLIILITYNILKYSHRINDQIQLCFCFCLLGRYFVVFNSVFYESMRIAYFFDYFIILLSSYLGRGIGRNYSRTIEKIGIVLLAFSYWIYYIMIIGGYVTNIYKFCL